MMKLVNLTVACVLATQLSCAGRRPSAVTTGLAEQTRTVSLRERTNQFWLAKTTSDWDAVFEFYEPKIRDTLVKSDYMEWADKNELFQIHSFDIAQVQASGEIGWAEVEYRTSLRRFPDLDPRTAKQWQKWRLVDRDWYPIPQKEIKTYPEAPALRDAREEQRLRSRFEASWEARRARDWHRLHQLTDPRDHEAASEEDFAAVEELFDYLSHRLDWIEVIGDQGRIRVTYHHKLTDKSMEKLPARDATFIEAWVKSENEWYLDLKRP